MKIVLDTNILIAALITRGICSQLLDHCFENHELLTSKFILDEVNSNLLKKFKFNSDDVAEVIELLQTKMQLVKPVELKTPVCRDRDDDMILATALAADAACIVTGDKDLLALQRFEMMDIISPSDFIDYELRYR